MEYSGLSNKEEQDFEKLLDSVARMREESEKLPGRILYSSVLENMALEFNSALKNKDFITLFDLESICQKHDEEYYGPGKVKNINLYPSMEDLKQIFIESLDPENVRSKYNSILPELEAHGTRVHDTLFETAIRLHSRNLGSYFGHASNFAEKNFYETRKKCLLALKHEHQRNLDRAMGYEKKKSPSKGKKQEISR